MRKEIISLLKNTEFPENMMGILEKNDFDEFKRELHQNIVKWGELFEKLPVVKGVYFPGDLVDCVDARLLEIQVRNSLKSFLKEGDGYISFCFTDSLYEEPENNDLKIMKNGDLSEGLSDSIFKSWNESVFPSHQTRLSLGEFFDQLCKLEKTYAESVPPVITQSSNGGTITIPVGEIPVISMDEDFYNYASIIVNFLRSGFSFVQAANNLRFGSQGGFEISFESLEKRLEDLQLPNEKFKVMTNHTHSVIKIERIVEG